MRKGDFRTDPCWECGQRRHSSRQLPHGRICTECRRRRHYHPQPCPDCSQVRPLAWPNENGAIVCASCADAISIFACRDCGREDHPYGSSRCARCILRERLTALLTDPSTGEINSQLRPVFDELVGSERPQTGIWWLRKKPGIGPRLLGQMARGEVEISHDTFRALPPHRALDYLRNLLTALGVLPAFDIQIERTMSWLPEILAGLPEEHAVLIERFARWHVLRNMRQAADAGRMTQNIANGARRRIRVAVDLLAYFEAHGATAATATQDLLERYLEDRARGIQGEAAFLVWLRQTRTNTRLRAPYAQRPGPTVIVTEDQRWAVVDRLLHDPSLRHYTRVGGLFALLFAQPINRVVAMRTDQVHVTDDNVYVQFGDVEIQMPDVLNDIIREHLQRRGKSLYASRDTGWLFPGGNPGRHLATESFRRELADLGIQLNEGRKAALFQLASQTPAPVLAELIAITHEQAVSWAKLAARDWNDYIAQRAH